MVSGSDTHQAVQYGCVTTVFERDVDTVVRTACLLKRSLKEIHALGGDYVAILTREATA